MSWSFLYRPEANGVPLVANSFASNGLPLPGGDLWRGRQRSATASTIPDFPVVSDVDSIWGNHLDLSSPVTLGTAGNTNASLQFPMANSWPSSVASSGGRKFDVYMRFEAQATSGNYGLWGLTGYQNNARAGVMSIYLDNASSEIQVANYNEDQIRFFSFLDLGGSPITWTVGTRYDYMWRFDYTTAPCTIEFYIDGVSQGTTNGSASHDWGLDNIPANGMMLQVGANYTFGGTRINLDHIGIYDGYYPSPAQLVEGGDIDDELLALPQSQLVGGGRVIKTL